MVLISDHRAFAGALAFRLGIETDIVMEAVATTEGAAAAVASRRPDLAIVDVEVDSSHALALVGRLRQILPGLVVVVVASGDEARVAAAAIRAGAAGFVAKHEPVTTMIEATRACAEGRTWFPRRLLGELIDEIRGGPGGAAWNDERTAVERLTPREREVFDLILAGLDRNAIAARLLLSTNTVRTHVRNLLRKLGVHSSIEAVGIGLRAGLRPSNGTAPRKHDYGE
jgi:DNA-binding NarL/FixJ family response regulator